MKSLGEGGLPPWAVNGMVAPFLVLSSIKQRPQGLSLCVIVTEHVEMGTDNLLLLAQPILKTVA